jgi:hypothetical protein
MTFDEFVAFFFSHDTEKDEHWAFDVDSVDLWSDETSADARLAILLHLTRLFTTFPDAAARFSLKAINTGIWPMFSQPFELHRLLWDSSLPINQRADCIRSMYSVYADFVATSDVEVMENCFDMWWDFVANGFWFHQEFENGVRQGDCARLDSDSRIILDAMFATLRRILSLPDRRTQSYALHGLGHLHHPDVRNLVQAFIDRHRTEFSPEGLAWVEQCRDGTVM